MSKRFLNLEEITFKDDELKSYIKGSLEEWKENGTLTEEFIEDLHFHLFNEDYYIIGTYKAKEWLKGYTFDVIEYIKEYEQFNFGECNTNLSCPEAVVNMFAYIRGEELLSTSVRYEFDHLLEPTA
tara:strand:- start:1883 stop:2260 length:378 start_codon:yes stop_codon:yes gene_type:complete